MGVVQKTDWLAALTLKRHDATPGTWFAMRPEPSEPGEPLGSPIGIGSAWEYLTATPSSSWEVEQGIEHEPEECCEMLVVGLLAWDERGDELPRCEENIDYLCALHNQFPVLASELRALRAYRERLRVATEAIRALRQQWKDETDTQGDAAGRGTIDGLGRALDILSREGLL